jgi:hypothetical protein
MHHQADPHRECCSDAACDSGLRNNYFEGKRLTADAFRVEQDYLVDRRRLLNRAIHGWGVVHGFGMKSAAPDEEGAGGRFRIEPGLALDACGRELVSVRGSAVGLGDVVIVDGAGKRLSREDAGLGDPDERTAYREDPARECWLLSVHYAEQSRDPVALNDPCSCERNEWDHVCETVRYSLRRVDCRTCCDQHDCSLACDCGAGPCCDEHQRGKTPLDMGAAAARRMRTHPVQRGGCRCLCEHITGLQFHDDCDCLTEIEDHCARARVDLRHGVPLACVTLTQDPCGRWIFDDTFEACGPRRLVKRNDLLFDLIRGCDLTRISAIGWAPWHRLEAPVPYADFQASFGTEDPAGSGRNVTRDYWVEFSRPVREETVRPDCFSVTITIAEDEAGWYESRRVPIIDVIKSGGPDPQLITHALLVVEAGWANDAVTVKKHKIFNKDEALVEIAVFGDFILDCNGQAVDANAAGLAPAPTGNGTPGGTFHSNFRVAQSDA